MLASGCRWKRISHKSMPKPENNAKKLAVMIEEVKAEIAEQKQKVQQQSLSEMVMQ